MTSESLSFVLSLIFLSFAQCLASTEKSPLQARFYECRAGWWVQAQGGCFAEAFGFLFSDALAFAFLEHLGRQRTNPCPQSNTIKRLPFWL